MGNQEIIQLVIDLLPLLIPIILIQLALVIYALIDLSRREKTRGPRWAWALSLIITAVGFPTGIIVSAVYLLWGRTIEGVYDTD